jgi:hypothetical protein
MERNLVKKILNSGGTLTPLIIPSTETEGTGLMNPSIFLDGEELLLNLRHVNYTLYHSEGGQIFQNRWGPLAYLNPENDIHLRTNNFFCVLHPEAFMVTHYGKVDTSKLDIEPVWEFIGLEDARIAKWDDKMFLIGCRRDVKDNGESRMELSEIIVDNNGIKEINRSRIETTDPSNYCEKNWMPILDMPYHFVKWTNPTEVVKVDMQKLAAETVFQADKDTFIPLPDLRGSSQVIPYKDFRICITHELNFFRNKLEQKDATYMHRFVVWDQNWNIVKITEPFSFMTGEIEFCCGATLYKEDLLITFGFQDNAAYLLKIPKNCIDNILELENYGKSKSK